MFKWIVLIPLFVVFLSGCTNRTSFFNHGESIDRKSSENNTLSIAGNILQKMPVPLVFNVSIGSNVSGNISVPITIPELEPATLSASGTISDNNLQESKQKSDIKITEKETVYNPFTLILIGIGGLLILLVIYIVFRWLKNCFSMMGGDIALESVSNFIKSKRASNLDPIRDGAFKELEDELKDKILRLSRKRGK